MNQATCVDCSAVFTIRSRHRQTERCRKCYKLHVRRVRLRDPIEKLREKKYQARYYRLNKERLMAQRRAQKATKKGAS